MMEAIRKATNLDPRRSLPRATTRGGNDSVCCDASLNNKSVIPAKAGIHFLFLLITLFISTHAHADSPTVDPKLCNALVKHTPDANVAYQPGVDVHGNAVAPADLPLGERLRGAQSEPEKVSPQMQLPSEIKIPLTINLAKAINLNTSAYPYNQLGTGTEATLVTLSVEGDRVTFNGQPLSDTQQDNLAVLCMQPK